MTQPSAMDTGSGSGTQSPLGVSTPPSGPLSSPIDEAAGYALEIHDEFWATVPSKKRAKLVTDFVARAKAAGSASEVAKQLVRGLGVDVPDYRAAAAILAGYEAHEWVLVDWAGPRFVPISEARLGWLKQLLAKEEEDDTADVEKDEDPEAEGTAKPTAISPLTLKRLRRRKAPPRWSDKLRPRKGPQKRRITRRRARRGGTAAAAPPPQPAPPFHQLLLLLLGFLLVLFRGQQAEEGKGEREREGQGELWGGGGGGGKKGPGLAFK